MKGFNLIGLGGCRLFISFRFYLRSFTLWHGICFFIFITGHFISQGGIIIEFWDFSNILLGIVLLFGWIEFDVNRIANTLFEHLL
eukprot:UN23301